MSRIQTWLAPPPFAETFEESLGLAREDTGNWFLKDPRFTQWLRSPIPAREPQMQTAVFDSRTLWVYGIITGFIFACVSFSRRR